MAPCKFFLQGKCTKGAACTFEHGAPKATAATGAKGATVAKGGAAAPPGGVCKYFVQGSCTRGADCKFAHPGAPPKQVKPRGADKVSLTLDITKARRTLDFVVAVDVSGSMQGRPLELAIGGLEEVVTDRAVMHPEDWYALAAFDHQVHTLHRFKQRKAVNFGVDKANLQKAGGGGTAIWDAIASGIAELRSLGAYRREKGIKCDSVVEHLVLTDGADGGSSVSVRDIAALVAEPKIANYHLVLITVGVSERDLQVMRTICAPRHAKIIELANMEQLRGALAKFKHEVVTKLTVTNGATGQKYVEEHRAKGGGKGAQQELLKLGAQLGKQLQTAGGLALGNGAAKPRQLKA